MNRQAPPAVYPSLDVRDIAVQLRGWTMDGVAAAPFRVAARVTVPEGRSGAAVGSRAAAGSGVVGTLEASGELKGFADGVPKAAQASLLLRDLPLHLLDPYLRIVLLALQLELDVQADDLRVLEVFRLLLEAGVGECLFECDAVDEHGVLERAAGDFFDADELLVQVVLVEG